MICLAATYVIKPGHETEAIEHFRKLTELTRAEPGNLFYQVHRSIENPRRFFTYEQYVDQAALEAHRSSPHFVLYDTNVLSNILESRTAELYEPLTWL
jgi:quinol monooxygenase YgiN